MSMTQRMLDPITEVIDEFQNGRIVILVDDEDRENEGDLVMPAQYVTPEAVNFMATHGRGLICLTVEEAIAQRIGLKPMVPENQSGHGTAFTISIEAAQGISTGISAHDRAHTIQVAVNPAATAADIVSPGHVFPLVAKRGGVLVRAGHTEASVDLSRMCRLIPAAVICEIMNPDGSMARLPDLRTFADKHGLKLGSIADLIRHRLERDSLVRVLSDRVIESRLGKPIRMRIFENDFDGQHHIALTTGTIDPAQATLVRMHGEDFVEDLFGALLHREPSRLSRALDALVRAESGALIYLRRQASGGQSPVADKAMDLRSYGIGAQILRAVGVRRFRLLSDNPRKIVGLEGFGLDCVGVESLQGQGV